MQARGVTEQPGNPLSGINKHQAQIVVANVPCGRESRFQDTATMMLD